MTSSPIAGEREAAPALEVVRMLEDMCKFADQSDGKLSTSLVREYIGDLRAALLEPVGEGWVMVPKEPTDEMLTRAVYAIACGTAREVALKHYRAMIAASPKSNGGMGS